ncbi:MAG: transporter substrate-binding domain-containing protein [Bacteroidota bacterium]
MKAVSNKGLFLIISLIGIGFPGITTSSCTVDAVPSDQSKKKIVVGGDFDYKPYTFTDSKGTAKGFDVDVIKYIAEKNNYTLEFNFSRWDKALESLENGDVDVLLGILYTERRDSVYDFTIPHSEEYYGIFVREGCSIKDVSDLTDKEIIALEGDASVERFIKPMGFEENSVFVNSLPKAIHLLSTGKCHAVLAPYSIGMETVEESGIKNIEVVGPPILPSLYRFAVQEGNIDLLSDLNDGIDNIKSTGKIEELREKWQFHRRKEISFLTVVRYAAIGLIPIILVILGLSLWSRSLKKQVHQKTKILNEKNASLEKLNATKDKLFSVIGHDLRSPFNSILGYSDLLINNKNEYSDDKFKYFLKGISTTAENTLNLLENLLYWARSQTGQIKYQPEKIRLEEVIAQSVNFANPSAGIKNISLNYLPNYETEIYADGNMLRAILRNLISNAIKFTHINGKIDIYSIYGQNEVEITVSDNGTGMDEDTRNSLFQADANISSKGTANEDGTGLGLILCKEFVEIHGGKIWVESEMGKGSDFHFSVPFRKNDERG